MPPAIQRSNRQALQVRDGHRDPEYHGLRPPAPGSGGLGAVADEVLDWAAGSTLVDLPHPRRRADRAHRGRGLATPDRPDLRPGGRSLRVRVGTSSRQADRAGRRRLTTSAPIDAVLLTHAHHGDNLDAAGRALLPAGGHGRDHRPGRAPARRAAPRGLAPGRRPAGGARPTRPRDHRHAVPPRTSRSAPHRRRRVGFSARVGGQEQGARRISGDTVLYDGVRDVARRLDVDVLLVHLGACGSGHGPDPLHDDGRRGCRAVSDVQPRVAVPVHYEGWSHFKDGRERIQDALAGATPTIGGCVRWLTPGSPTDVS